MMNTKDYIDEELKELLDVEKNRYFQLLEMQNILDIKEHMDIVAFKELQNYYKGMETYDTKERACVKIELYNFLEI